MATIHTFYSHIDLKPSHDKGCRMLIKRVETLPSLYLIRQCYKFKRTNLLSFSHFFLMRKQLFSAMSLTSIEKSEWLKSLKSLPYMLFNLLRFLKTQNQNLIIFSA